MTTRRALSTLSFRLAATLLLAGNCLPATVAAEEDRSMPRLVLKELFGAEAGQELALPIEADRLQVSAETAAASREVALQLTLQEAARQTVLHNRDIQRSSYDPARALEDLTAARSVYDSTLFQSANLSHTDRPIESILDNGDADRSELLEDRWDFQAGVKKLLPTGSTVSVFMETGHLDSSSELVIPNPQYTSRLTAQLRQALLKEIGDRSNRAKIKLADLFVDRSNEEFRQNLADILESLAKTYWQLSYDLGYEEIRRQALAMAEDVHRRESARMQQGLANPADVDRALAKVQSRRIDLNQASHQATATARQLLLLMGLPDAGPADSAGIRPSEEPLSSPLFLDPAETLEMALRNRPELILAHNEVEAATVRKNLARHRLLPRLDAKASYTLNSLGQSFERALDDTYVSDDASWLVGIEFEYPLGNRKAASEYRKAIYEEKQAAIEVDKVRDLIGLEINLALADLDRIAREIEISTSVQETLGQVVDRTRTRFELGQMTSEELLQFEDLLTDARTDRLKTVINYNLKLLALRKAQGTLLDEFGITLAENSGPVAAAAAGGGHAPAGETLGEKLPETPQNL